MSNEIGIATNEILPLQMKKVEKSLIEVKFYTYIKRTADIMVSSIALVFLLPLFAVISIFIKSDSKGKAIFTQTRIGEDGKLFKLYKFRTMIPNADEKLKELLAKDNSAR